MPATAAQPTHHLRRLLFIIILLLKRRHICRPMCNVREILPFLEVSLKRYDTTVLTGFYINTVPVTFMYYPKIDGKD